jgi:hypothetical protein
MFRLPMRDRSGKELRYVSEFLKGLALNTDTEEKGKQEQKQDKERIMQKLRSLGYM